MTNLVTYYNFGPLSPWPWTRDIKRGNLVPQYKFTFDIELSWDTTLPLWHLSLGRGCSNGHRLNTEAHFMNGCSIVIQNRWKFDVRVNSWQDTISLLVLHMLRQHSCRAMCKIHGDHFTTTWIKSYIIFHWKWIAMKKSVNWAPGCFRSYEIEQRVMHSNNPCNQISMALGKTAVTRAR